MNNILLISIMIIVNIILVLGLENSESFAVGNRK